ncbi:MAG: hypothetical protein KDC35_03740 [Acidobacteria bacterium]|nr:hypothetical protein [Acidobacteriota bacterium]
MSEIKRLIAKAVVIQVIALSLAAWFHQKPLLPLSTQEAEIFGQTLTLILLAGGLWAYFHAPKRPVPMLVLLMMAQACPIYAALGGPVNNLVAYGAIGLVGTALAIFRRHKGSTA